MGLRVAEKGHTLANNPPPNGRLQSPATIGFGAGKEQQCAGTTLWRTSSGAHSSRTACPILAMGSRARLPEPLRLAAGGRFVVLDGQRPMGPLQRRRRLPARLSCRQLRSAQNPAGARPRGRHPDYVANACPSFRTAPRRAVSPLSRALRPRERSQVRRLRTTPDGICRSLEAGQPHSPGATSRSGCSHGPLGLCLRPAQSGRLSDRSAPQV
jgi:hypothetical protein